jgi:ElaB/YqjD/DUF883 family membrane-anchored ribosome-binding protein
MTTGERSAETGPDRVTTDKVMADVALLAADMEELLKATANQTGQHLAEVRAKAEQSLRAARTRLSDLQDAALERSCAAGRAADDYVRANPWPFIATGAVAGLVLGSLAMRRGRSA